MTFKRLTLAAAALEIDDTGRHVTARTLYNAWKSGRLSARRIGRSVMVSREALAEYVGEDLCQGPTEASSSITIPTVIPRRRSGLSTGQSVVADSSVAQASQIAAQLKKQKRSDARSQAVEQGRRVRSHQTA